MTFSGFLRRFLTPTVLILSIAGTGLLLPFASGTSELIFERDYSTGLRFVPALPTDKSNITAHIPIFYPDLCHSATFDGYQINENIIEFDVTHYFSGGPGFGCPAAIYNPVFHANLGQLDPGNYEAHLMINGTEVLSRQLVVSTGDLEIVSTGKYTDLDDRNHIIGEISNAGTLPVANVSALISFYDQDNIELATDYAFPAIDLLFPNQSSGFDYLVTSHEILDGAFKIRINHYDLIETPKNADLELTVTTKKFLQPYGDAFIGGNVTNNSDNLTSGQTIVVCTLYDYSKTIVIDTIVNHTTPVKIDPGKTAQYVVYSNYHPVDSSYEATCSAGEETIGARVIPEFDSSLGIIIGIPVGITGVLVSARFFHFSLPFTLMNEKEVHADH